MGAVAGLVTVLVTYAIGESLEECSSLAVNTTSAESLVDCVRNGEGFSVLVAQGGSA